MLYAAFPAVTLLAIANFVGTPFGDGKPNRPQRYWYLCTGWFQHDELLVWRDGAALPKRMNASLAARRRRHSRPALCTVGFIAVMNLIEGNAQLSYIFAATLFSLFGLLFMWLCYAGALKKRYVEVKPVDNAQSPDYCSRSAPSPVTVRCLFCVSPTFALGAFNVKLAIQVYYTQYVLNDPITPLWMGFFMGCIFIGVF